jgi:putative transposase
LAGGTSVIQPSPFPRYGYRRVMAELAQRGLTISHKRVQRLMHEHDLLQHWQRSWRTANSQHGFRRYPSLLRSLAVVRPDEVWCVDITYVRLAQGFVYLAIVLDVFTRSLRGWALGLRLDTAFALEALDQALAAHRPEIHHSDDTIRHPQRHRPTGDF